MREFKLIPMSTLQTLAAWIETARPMGSFCQAVVSNDLMGAYTRADPKNREALGEIVMWLRDNAPAGSWGHPDCLKTWKGTKPQ